MHPLVVVPTYNEAENLPLLVAALVALEPPLRVLVVDDASPDGTGILAARLSHDHPGRLEVLRRPAKQGLGVAYVAGFTRALALAADPIFQMDADLSHPPQLIPEMLARLRGGADVVVGSRYVAGGGVDRRWGAGRRLLSRTGNLYARWVTGLRVRDATAGFKGWRRAALERVDPGRVHAQGYLFQIEMAVACQRAGLRVVEVPIVFRERAAGRSKMTLRVALEAAWRIWRLRA